MSRKLEVLGRNVITEGVEAAGGLAQRHMVVGTFADPVDAVLFVHADVLMDAVTQAEKSLMVGDVNRAVRILHAARVLLQKKDMLIKLEDGGDAG